MSPRPMWSDEALEQPDGSFVWAGGKWTDTDSGETITAANDVDYKAGTGFWVDCPDLEDCDALVFAFPACLAK